jgi:hypothetical protein
MSGGVSPSIVVLPAVAARFDQLPILDEVADLGGPTVGN